MPLKNILSLNYLEKQIIEDIVQKIEAGLIPMKGQCGQEDNIFMLMRYECRFSKHEKVIKGTVLGAAYELRYRSRNLVFFSAGECRDIEDLFYDMIISMIMVLKSSDLIKLEEFHLPFEPDLATDRYIFSTGELAGTIAKFIAFLNAPGNEKEKELRYNSRILFRLFDVAKPGVYTELLQKLNNEGYSNITILDMWIRGEILYYVVTEGPVLRPAGQRDFTEKEEKDLIRKIGKYLNNMYKPIDSKG